MNELIKYGLYFLLGGFVVCVSTYLGAKGEGFLAALARIIHDGSSRNRGVATRDGRAESREAEAYLKQYAEVTRGEPARQHATQPHAGLSQRRIRDCSRIAHG